MELITEQEFRQLVAYFKANYGVDLSRKKHLVVGRLQNYVRKNNYKSFSDYFQAIVRDKTGETANTLINRLTTNHTFFMRESGHFDFFKNTVLPGLIAREQKKKDLRIWSAGCSSGEEPYTLAMIIADYFGPGPKGWDTRILATDISTRVLKEAVGGIYPNNELEPLPEQWRKKYFRPINGEKSQISEVIRNEVIFRKFNLMEKVFPFGGKFHVIFCRNVMIYFDAETKRQLVAKFYDFLENSGYLFIGHSESLDREETKFRYILPAIYRKD